MRGGVSALPSACAGTLFLSLPLTSGGFLLCQQPEGVQCCGDNVQTHSATALNGLRIDQLIQVET